MTKDTFLLMMVKVYVARHCNTASEEKENETATHRAEIRIRRMYGVKLKDKPSVWNWAAGCERMI